MVVYGWYRDRWLMIDAKYAVIYGRFRSRLERNSTFVGADSAVLFYRNSLIVMATIQLQILFILYKNG